MFNTFACLLDDSQNLLPNLPFCCTCYLLSNISQNTQFSSAFLALVSTLNPEQEFRIILRKNITLSIQFNWRIPHEFLSIQEIKVYRNKCII